MKLTDSEKYRIAKMETMLPAIWTLPGQETADECANLFGIVTNMMKTSENPITVVEVGTYSGRLGHILACAFQGVADEGHKLILVDDGKGLRDLDPDGLPIYLKRYHDAETKSGVDVFEKLSFDMRMRGLLADGNVHLQRSDMKSAGDNWSKGYGDDKISYGDEKINFIIFNNFLRYKPLLEISNAWLKWLRLGGVAYFTNCHMPEIAGVPRELVMLKKWKDGGQYPVGPRVGVMVQRPLDETSGEG